MIDAKLPNPLTRRLGAGYRRISSETLQAMRESDQEYYFPLTQSERVQLSIFYDDNDEYGTDPSTMRTDESQDTSTTDEGRNADDARSTTDQDERGARAQG